MKKPGIPAMPGFHRSESRCYWFASTLALILALAIFTALPVTMVFFELEEIKEVPDCRTVLGDVRIVPPGFGVREIVAAALGERLELPVALNKFKDRNVIRVGMVDMSTGGERRNHDQGNSWSIAKE